MRKFALIAPVLVAVFLSVGAAPAQACGGLIGPNGAVNLVRTTTLAGYADGVEHYVTAFQFAGGSGEFGSIIPLPGVPTTVERGGDWTLQRLVRETAPPVRFAAAEGAAVTAGAPAPAEVILQTKVDALDITVLKGGGEAVGDWARDHGFLLPPDAPEVLDFYARRSPIFLAARFDADAARQRGQRIGDGTPVHITIPTENPWVPLRILALGKQPSEQIQADVYLLTPTRPALLPNPSLGRSGLLLERSEPASPSLVTDLQADQGMGWMPNDMWLTYLKVDAKAGQLGYDLATDVSGRATPSTRAAGLTEAPVPLSDGMLFTPLVLAVALGIAAVIGVVAVRLARVP